MNPVLELRQVACVRGLRTLFEGLDLSLQPGQLLRLQGANGAGKTSLLRMLCGLLAPAQGEVLWRGRRIETLREEFSKELVYLGHAAALKDDLSALENLMTACVLGGVGTRRAEAIDALAAAGLGGRERAPARILSQGQRKRVALARLVLSRGAALWVLDEPFNALDTAASAWLIGLITAQLGNGGIVVLTSHQSVPFDDSVPQAVLTL
ncbi:MAG: cytochrome c biogenesis heme-transporting ATPase CcmA [Rhizobacter sp.]|nr:cytochrome c biogenesis heme-transporting ATPase CcmA [Rhizobacter sp.]